MPSVEGLCLHFPLGISDERIRDSLVVEKQKILECETVTIFPFYLLRRFKCMIILLIVHLSAFISDFMLQLYHANRNRHYMIVFDE